MAPPFSMFGLEAAPKVSHARFLHHISRIAPAIVAGIGASVLLGWAFEVPLLKSILPGVVSMKPNAAIGFLLTGSALSLLHRPHPLAWRIAQALGLLTWILAALTLAEDLVGIDLAIDRLIFPTASLELHTLHPGRMAPVTSFNFMLIGAVLLGLKPGRSPGLKTWAYYLVLPVLFTSSVALAGYAYGVEALYRVGALTPMAIHTGGAFLLLSLGVLTADPTHKVTNLAISDTAGGIVFRRLVPAIPLVLFGVGWIGLLGQKAGYYDAQFRLALTVVLSIAVCLMVVVSIATELRAVDLQRRHAEMDLIALNADLERRVQERTLELEHTLAEVKQLSGLLPICAWCKKVRDDNDYWQTVEQYVTAKTDAHFTHSICPECRQRLLAEQEDGQA